MNLLVIGFGLDVERRLERMLRPSPPLNAADVPVADTIRACDGRVPPTLPLPKLLLRSLDVVSRTFEPATAVAFAPTAAFTFVAAEFE